MTTTPTELAAALVPTAGAEQAVDQAAKRKQPLSAEPTTGETLALDLITDAIDVVIAIFD